MGSTKISRNGPCPCGSGMKYKRCCLNNPAAKPASDPLPSEEPFRAGSYGDWGEFHPAIACASMKQQRVLVKKKAVYMDEAGAAAHADIDLRLALDQAAGSNQDGVIDILEASGYEIKHSPRLIKEDGNEEKMSLLHDAMNNVIAANIRDNQPPEARAAFDRLTSLGYSRTHAFLLIKMVVVAEMWRSAERHEFPDADRTIDSLNALPELPDFMRSSARVNPPPVRSRIFA